MVKKLPDEITNVRTRGIDGLFVPCGFRPGTRNNLYITLMKHPTEYRLIPIEIREIGPDPVLNIRYTDRENNQSVSHN